MASTSHVHTELFVSSSQHGERIFLSKMAEKSKIRPKKQEINSEVFIVQIQNYNDIN